MKKILPISVLLFLAFVIASFVLPGKAAEYGKKKKQLTLLTQQVESIPSLNTAVLAKSEQLSVLTQAFPAKRDAALVAQAIDSLAAKNQVQASLHFESEEAVKDERGDFVLPVSITVEGDYAAILAFLEGINSGRYLFALSSLEGDSQNGIKNKNKLVIGANLYAADK